MRLNNLRKDPKMSSMESGSGDTRDNLIDGDFNRSFQRHGISSRKALFVRGISICAVVIGLVGIALLIFSCVFINNPGPSLVYNRFPALLMSACLIFQCTQLFLFSRSWAVRTTFIKTIFRWIYWGVIVPTTFIAGVAWAVGMKPDVAALQFLACAAGILGLILLFWNRTESVQQIRAKDRWYVKFGRGFNRFLKVIHAAFCILFTSGAITLALQFKYTYPGTSYSIPLPNGPTITMNIYCTGSPPTSPSNPPTIWLESTQAHGITDFLGLQTYLLNDHNRHSCSYDHISQGFSSAAPKDFTNSSMYWSSMLNVLGRQDEPYIGVGWGGGGEDVVSHALESPSTTKGLVLMDSSPDGIEWMDEARKKGWDESMMLNFRDLDLGGRVTLTQIVLALGIPWGLMPVFVPVNGTKYFDQAYYPAHHAQSLKDDLWAFQYYFLIKERSVPKPDTYLADSILPTSIPVYSIMTNNSNDASSVFQLDKKIELVDHLAGGKDKVKGQKWCTDRDCDLGFPVDKAKWTADRLIELGI